MKIRLKEPLAFADALGKPKRHEPGEIVDLPDEIARTLAPAHSPPDKCDECKLASPVGRNGVLDAEGNLVLVAGMPIGDGALIFAAERVEQSAPAEPPKTTPPPPAHAGKSSHGR